MRWDSLLKDVLRVHPPVVLGQFDGEDDAGDEKDGAASQTKPEGVLENTSGTKTFTCSSTGHRSLKCDTLTAQFTELLHLNGLIPRINLNL